LVIGFLAGGGIGYWYGSRPLLTQPSETKPIVITPISKPVPGQPFFLTVDELNYFERYLSCMITATAQGKAKLEIDRPLAWSIPTRMWTLGLGGGYYCGYWMPGGTIGHLWRIGGIRKLNLYMGPELAISAYDKTNIDIPVAVSIFAKVAITY
jgi:hypothetical protein